MRGKSSQVHHKPSPKELSRDSRRRAISAFRIEQEETWWRLTIITRFGWQRSQQDKLPCALRFATKRFGGDQSVNVICGMIKAFCVAISLSIAVQRSGLPESCCHVIAALVTGPLLIFNQSAFFWRNMFNERADAAFDTTLRNHHRN